MPSTTPLASALRTSARRRSCALALVIGTLLSTAACATDVTESSTEQMTASSTVGAPAPGSCAGSKGKGKVGGSQGYSLLGLGDSDLDRVLTIARDAGMWSMRIDVDWSAIEPTRGVRDWRSTDRVVRAVLAHGLCPLGVVGFTPAWAIDPALRPDGSHYPPENPQLFAQFVRATAQRYRGSISVWEIWNEPNLVTYFKPSPDVAKYGALLIRAYAAIKSVDRTMSVISGGLAPSLDKDGNIAPLTFVQRMYDDGFNNSFDALGMHPYTYPFLPNDPTTRSFSAAQQMFPMHDIMTDNGDGRKLIWMTEFGAPTGASTRAVTDAVQSNTILIALHAAHDVPWLGPLYIYGIRDSGPDTTNSEQNFGIVRWDFSPKPAYFTVAQFGLHG